MLGLPADVTVDALERRLLEREEMISVLRADQAITLEALDAAQVHMTDGSRSMIGWVAARLDVSHDTARLLTRSAALMADQPAVARRLATGEIGVERAVAAAELAGVAPAEIVEWSEGLDLGGVRRLVARYTGRIRRSDVEVFAGRYQPSPPRHSQSSPESCADGPHRTRGRARARPRRQSGRAASGSDHLGVVRCSG